MRQNKVRPKSYDPQTMLDLLAEIRAQLKFIDGVRLGSTEKLIRFLNSYGRERGYRLHGKLDRLFSEDQEVHNRHWREELVLSVIRLRGEPAVRQLIKAADKQHNPLLPYAIGLIGGPKAVDYLTRKAVGEPNMLTARDYFYPLLLTGDESARAVVEKRAKKEQAGSEASPARWALSAALPPLAR